MIFSVGHRSRQLRIAAFVAASLAEGRVTPPSSIQSMSSSSSSLSGLAEEPFPGGGRAFQGRPLVPGPLNSFSNFFAVESKRF